jgi:hypothetical protein
LTNTRNVERPTPARQTPSARDQLARLSADAQNWVVRFKRRLFQDTCVKLPERIIVDARVIVMARPSVSVATDCVNHSRVLPGARPLSDALTLSSRARADGRSATRPGTVTSADTLSISATSRLSACARSYLNTHTQAPSACLLSISTFMPGNALRLASASISQITRHGFAKPYSLHTAKTGQLFWTSITASTPRLDMS